MTPRPVKTKDVDKFLYANFLKRAHECFNAARYSFGREEWTASAISAVHSAIAACDAVCVYFLGRRSSGENHNDAAVLFKTVGNDAEITAQANRIVRIIRTKNIAEYEKRLIFKSEAERILGDCEKLLEFAVKRLA